MSSGGPSTSPSEAEEKIPLEGGGGGGGGEKGVKGRPRSKSTSTFSKLVKMSKNLPHASPTPTPPVPDLPITPKGSVTPGAVFGQNLPTDPEQLEEGVPKVVYRLCRFLIESGLTTEGLFRVPGNSVEVKRLMAVIDEGNFPELENHTKTIHIVAAILKSYFRGLPEPLLTYELYDMFIAASGVPEQATRLLKIKQVLSYLPSQNYSLLVFLILFLREVSKCSSVTLMNSENLAIVFAPNLLRSKNIAREEANDTPYANQLLQTMIDDFDRIFEGTKPPKLFQEGGAMETKIEVTTPKEKKSKAKASSDHQDAFFEDVRHSRHEHVSKALASGKVDVNSVDPRGWSALVMSVHRSDIPMMEILLKSGCNINHQNQKGETALIRAVSIGTLDAVRFLLEKGAKHDVVNDEGRSPLHLASYAGEKEMCSLLIGHGAIVDLRDPGRKTPLLLAAYAGHRDVCALLLDNGASISKSDEFGWTSLMMASFAGHSDVVNLLLDRGASITTANKKGKTASMLATEAGNEEIVKLLTTSRIKRRKDKRHSAGKVLDDRSENPDDLTVNTLSFPSSSRSKASRQEKATSIATTSKQPPFNSSVSLDSLMVPSIPLPNGKQRKSKDGPSPTDSPSKEESPAQGSPSNDPPSNDPSTKEEEPSKDDPPPKDALSKEASASRESLGREESVEREESQDGAPSYKYSLLREESASKDSLLESVSKDLLLRQESAPKDSSSSEDERDPSTDLRPAEQVLQD